MFPRTSNSDLNLIRRYNTIVVNGESLYEIKRRKRRHKELEKLFKRQRKEFSKQPSVVLQEDPIPLPPPGSLAYLKLKLNDPNAVFTADELAGYYYNTLNMAYELNPNELNKFYDIVTNSITEEPLQVNRILNDLQDSLINMDKDSVTRQLFPPDEMEGGKSRSRTTHKGRKSRKTRKSRNTRKHRTLRK
jgi:hypothetical protein